MNIKLVVVHPFANYQRGDEITAPEEIAETLAGEAASKVVQVAMADAPASQPKSNKVAPSA